MKPFKDEETGKWIVEHNGVRHEFSSRAKARAGKKELEEAGQPVEEEEMPTEEPEAAEEEVEEGGPITDLDVFTAIDRMAAHLRSLRFKTLAEEGITDTQAETIIALEHGTTTRDLKEIIGCSGGNLTMVIDNLVKKGLVTRERDENDRRCLLVELTSEGKKMKTKLKRAKSKAMSKAFSDVHEDFKSSIVGFSKHLTAK